MSTESPCPFDKIIGQDVVRFVRLREDFFVGANINTKHAQLIQEAGLAQAILALAALPEDDEQRLGVDGGFVGRSDETTFLINSLSLYPLGDDSAFKLPLTHEARNVTVNVASRLWPQYKFEAI